MNLALRTLLAGVVSWGWLLSARADAQAARQQSLAELRRRLPKSESWEAWLQRTGELPPAFETLPGCADLPDPLRFSDGTQVRSRRDWRQRREELLRLLQHYLIGTVPPPPGNVRPDETSVRDEPGALVRAVTLAFGPAYQARLHLELLVPPGRGPFPVFLTQDNHRRWASVALSRGYLACVYAGADSRDDTGAWTNVWPECDWTKLTRRAWAASRCVDYLLTLPEVDGRQIALAGHSRNGKTSLIAAALDPRIGAVISSSSGAGGACPWRLFSESQFGEGIELITRQFPDWLHPRLRFFVGRENKLPFDQHELIACIAPRPCLISTALNDSVESVWAIERAARAARPVYALLGAANALNRRYREGGHPTRAEDLESYLDWLDHVFRRPAARHRPWHEPPHVFPTLADWKAAGGQSLAPRHFPARGLDDLLSGPADPSTSARQQWHVQARDIRRRIALLLGEAPPVAVSPAGEYGAETRPVASLLGRGATPTGLAKESLSFGNYLAGDLYYPADAAQAERRLPVLVWLHPLSVPNGYVAGYYRGEQPWAALARSGYAVFAFDQIGNGTRLREVQSFYRRYPRWSLLGCSVRDTRAAVDALLRHPRVAPDQVYLLGYATGAMVALHAAALDERVSGLIAVAGLTPMRCDAVEQGTGGLARWSDWLPLLPRLGAFVGQEARVPYDLHELLALVAPRPALIITPGIDYQSSFPALTECITKARRVYALHGAPESLVFQRTDDYHHFAPELLWCLCGSESIR
jgi:dienelactone hydrolase